MLFFSGQIERIRSLSGFIGANGIIRINMAFFFAFAI